MGRRYWRWILWCAASLGDDGLRHSMLGLMSGTPLPLLTTLIILELVPGAVVPWRWYWSGVLAMTGIGTMLAMQTLISEQFPWRYPWNHYWLALIAAISLAFVSDVVRDLRRTKRGLTRLQPNREAVDRDAERNYRGGLGCWRRARASYGLR